MTHRAIETPAGGGGGGGARRFAVFFALWLGYVFGQPVNGSAGGNS